MQAYSKLTDNVDWGVIILVLAITAIGLLCLYSSTSVTGIVIFYKQLLWVFIGLLSMFLTFALDYRALTMLAWPFYVVVIVLLLVVLVGGREISGSRRWLSLGPLGIQPSELAKIMVIVWVGYWGSQKKHVQRHGLRELLFPLATPNGIGLSPAGDRLYVAQTSSCRLLGYDVTGPGEIRHTMEWEAVLAGSAQFQMFDSLAVDAAGNVCVATLINGGITIVPPDGGAPRHVPVPDPMTTNICFGGPGLRTAYITASTSGRLLACEWETPGLALNFLPR